MKAIHRVVTAVIIFAAAIFLSTGTSHAGLDNELSLVNGKDQAMTIQQWDTSLNRLSALDRNRLSREWSHSGRAVFEVAGPAAEEFKGVLELGYQVGFPWAHGVGLNFSYTTPNISFWGQDWGTLATDDMDLDLIPGFGTPPLFPAVSISAELSSGPGIQEVVTFSKDVAGAAGAIAVSNGHGTVTGAAGDVLLRPFARLTSSTGDSVTTYGVSWTMN